MGGCMEIIQNRDGSKLILKIVGSLNSVSSDDLEHVIDESLVDIDDLVFDFEELNYLSSAGIRVLIATGNRMANQGQMRIINARNNEAIFEVLRITNLLEMLNVE